MTVRQTDGCSLLLLIIWNIPVKDELTSDNGIVTRPISTVAF